MAFLYFLMLLLVFFGLAYSLMETSFDKFMWAGGVLGVVFFLYLGHVVWLLQFFSLPSWPEDLV